MPRLRKQRRKQKFQYDVNRRRLNQKLNKLPKINCDAVRKAWDEKKSVNHNLAAMGLMADPNASVKRRKQPGEPDGAVEEPVVVAQSEVASELENEAREAFVKKKSSSHSLPPEMVKKLCAFLDKHGEDFEEMERDPTNFYQETAAQLRSQVNKLKKVPQQWIPYLKSRGLLSAEEEAKD